MNNCGITGESFGKILTSIEKNLTDFKSIIYKKNSFNKLSLSAISPLLKREVPYHLEELKLIDIKISSDITNELFELLRIKSSINKLALVHLNISERNFEILVEYIEKTKTLRELDLSWCEIRSHSFSKLFTAFSNN